MFIHTAMQDNQNFLSKSTVRVSDQPEMELTRVGRDKLEKAEQKLALAEETPAAVFTRSAQKDYAGKKLTPQQKAITELQDRIADLKSNDSLSPEEKKEQLKALDEQLSSLQEALQKSQADELEKFKPQKEAKEKADESKQSSAVPGETPVLDADTLALGASLERAQSAQSLSVKYKSDAKLQQHGLDDFIQRNDTPDANLVAKRRDEIRSADAAAGRLEDAAAAILKDTAATPAVKPQDRISESTLAQPKDAAADGPLRTGAADTSIAKSEDEERDKSSLL